MPMKIGWLRNMFFDDMFYDLEETTVGKKQTKLIWKVSKAYTAPKTGI